MRTGTELNDDIAAVDIHLASSVPPTSVEDAVLRTLERDADVDAQHIEALSEGSQVVLTGTVATSKERDLAGAAACNVPGVTSVENNLALSS